MARRRKARVRRIGGKVPEKEINEAVGTAGDPDQIVGTAPADALLEEIPQEPEVEVCPAGVMEVVAGGDRLFKVCFDYDLRIPDYILNISQGELDKYRGKVALMPYSHLLHRKLYDAGYGAWCYQMAISFMLKSGVEIKKVVEYCAGVGRATTIIQNELSPDVHMLMDINPELCRHLESAFPSNVVVRCGNYIEIGAVGGMDLSCIDNNSFTVLRFLTPKFGQKEFIIDVVKTSKFTLITDTAKSRFHLNKERYANLFGVDISDEYDYIIQFSKMMYELAGASVVFAASHPRASYMLFQKGQKPIEFELVHPEAAAKDYFQLAEGEGKITIREEAEVEEVIEEVAERPEKPKQKKDAKTKPQREEEDDSEIKRMMMRKKFADAGKSARTSRTQATKKNKSNKPQADVPDIEEEDIFESDSELKVVIVMAGGGGAGKSTISKAFSVGDPEELREPGAWYNKKNERNISGVNVTLYDNYALAGNHYSGTDSNSAPDLVRLAVWRALGYRDIAIIDGMVSSPQWVTALNNWPGDIPLHVMLVYFDLSAETLLERLAGRRGVEKESIRDDMFGKCKMLVRRAELLVGHFKKGSERPMDMVVLDKSMSPTVTVAAMDAMLETIYAKYDLDYDDMRS